MRGVLGYSLRQAVEGAPRPATTAGRGELWDESREREQWAEHSAGDAAASSGAVGSDRGFGRAAKLAALAALAVPLTAGCSVDEVLRFGWPDRRHAPGHQHARVLDVACIAALVVGVITWGTMFWAMIFHRKRAGESDVPPRQTQYNLPIEIIFTVVPTVIVAVLFAFTVQVQNYVDAE